MAHPSVPPIQKGQASGATFCWPSSSPTQHEQVAACQALATSGHSRYTSQMDVLSEGGFSLIQGDASRADDRRSRSLNARPPYGREHSVSCSVLGQEPATARSLVREISVASEALTCALSIARARFGTLLQTASKGTTGDIVTDVDLLCETKITEIIRAAFPEHSVIVEEAQSFHTAGPWTWIVDPLDGTNNYAYGLPLWGISITLCYQRHPVIACIAEGFSGAIIKAVCNEGVWVNEKPWAPTLETAKHRSAALWLGYDTDRESDDFQDVLSVLTKSTRRVFENWAPTIDVGLFLRSGIDVIVGKDCSGTELPAALTVLREAGARILDIHGADVSLDNVPNFFVAGRASVVHGLLRDLQIVLGS